MMSNTPSPGDMVGRVKLALFEALKQHLREADGLALQNGRFFISGADCHIDAGLLARAAIAAMREPTEAMCRPLSVSFEDEDVATYRAMIDAALTPQEVEG